MRKFLTVSLVLTLLLCFHLFHHRGHRSACACGGAVAVQQSYGCNQGFAVQSFVPTFGYSYAAPVAFAAPAYSQVSVFATPVEVVNVHQHQHVRVRSRGNRVSVRVN